MARLELNKGLDHYAEELRFQDWSTRQRPGVRFIYTCEYETFWKFTPKEWWRFVTRVIRNDGLYDLPVSAELHGRPRHVIRGTDGKYCSSDNARRCVNLLDWTLEDWKGELVGGERT